MQSTIVLGDPQPAVPRCGHARDPAAVGRRCPDLIARTKALVHPATRRRHRALCQRCRDLRPRQPRRPHLSERRDSGRGGGAHPLRLAVAASVMCAARCDCGYRRNPTVVGRNPVDTASETSPDTLLADKPPPPPLTQDRRLLPTRRNTDACDRRAARNLRHCARDTPARPTPTSARPASTPTGPTPTPAHRRLNRWRHRDQVPVSAARRDRPSRTESEVLENTPRNGCRCAARRPQCPMLCANPAH